jgi:hypothetical protein
MTWGMRVRSKFFRKIIGYTLQVSVLYVLTVYKLKLRDILFSDQYRHTIDTVRYIVLVVEPFVLVVYFWRLDVKKSSWSGVSFLTL